MLNGKAPLIIFHRTFKTPGGSLDGLQSIGRQGVIGIPIPIYLDERILGLVVENETRNIGIGTRVISKASSSSTTGTTEAPVTIQEGGESQTNISFLAKRSSIYLQTLLTFGDLALDAAASEEIKFSYFNGPTVMIMGVLNGITTTADRNDDLLRVSISFNRSPVPSWAAIALLTVGAIATQIVASKVVGSLPALP